MARERRYVLIHMHIRTVAGITLSTHTRTDDTARDREGEMGRTDEVGGEGLEEVYYIAYLRGRGPDGLRRAEIKAARRRGPGEGGA